MSGSLEGPLGGKVWRAAFSLLSRPRPTTHTRETKCRDPEGKKRMAKNNDDRLLNNFNFKQHIESRKGKCPEHYDGELPDL